MWGGQHLQAGVVLGTDHNSYSAFDDHHVSGIGQMSTPNDCVVNSV